MNLSVSLTGDSMVTRGALVNEDPASQDLAEILRGTDVGITNLEVVPSSFRGYPVEESGGAHLGAAEHVLDELIDIGFDAVSTANNHSLNFGTEGVLSTIAALNSRGLSFAGTGRNLTEARMPAYIDRPRGSVSLISCSSTFGRGQEAGAQKSDFLGRAGLNPLRFRTTYEVEASQMDLLESLDKDLGLEAQRQRVIDLAFDFPPESTEVKSFFGKRFRVGPFPRVVTEADPGDLEDIKGWVEEARTRSDVVVVAVHSHEEGQSPQDPAEFLREFAHAAIEAGADVVVGHGPHFLRGIELYRGKPIFYSLGNFVAQNELVERLPADSYNSFRVDHGETPGRMFSIRSRNGAKGFAAYGEFWETVVPVLRFSEDASGETVISEIGLHPATLGFSLPVRRRGRPKLATGQQGAKILNGLAELSKPYGTELRIENGTAFLALPSYEKGAAVSHV